MENPAFYGEEPAFCPLIQDLVATITRHKQSQL